MKKTIWPAIAIIIAVAIAVPLLKAKSGSKAPKPGQTAPEFTLNS